jgi:hypothetical protein
MAEYSEENGGVILDTIEVLCQKLGISVHSQIVAERETRKIIEGMDDYKYGGTLITQAHSQGAKTVHNLSRDIRRMMKITALNSRKGALYASTEKREASHKETYQEDLEIFGKQQNLKIATKKSTRSQGDAKTRRKLKGN